RRPHGYPANRVIRELNSEGRLRLGNGALGGHIVAIERRVLHSETGTLQPVLHLCHVVSSRGETRPELCRGEVMAVSHVAGIGYRFCQRLSGRRVYPAKIDSEAHVTARIGGADEVLASCPRRCASVQYMSRWRSRRDGGAQREHADPGE